MTTKGNLGASTTAQLLRRARETGDDVQTLLTHYCLERFLISVLDDLRRGAAGEGVWRSGGPWR